MVVGAGPAGLAVAGALARYGIRPVILEAGEAVGWAWRRHYPFLRLHTTRRDSSLPGLPVPRGGDPYAGRDEVGAYLERYAEQFAADVRLGHRVERIRRCGEDWEACTPGGVFRGRHLVVATGFNRRPHRPHLDGEATFGGPVLHSSRWSELPALLAHPTPAAQAVPREKRRLGAPDLAGRRVLVVGLGNTGADLVEELCRRGARVAVAQRGPAHLVPLRWLGVQWRTWYRIFPGAAFLAGRAVPALGAAAPRIAAAFWTAVQRLEYGDLEDRGLRLQTSRQLVDHWAARRAPLTSGPFLSRIRRGEVPVLPGLVRLHPGEAEVEGGGRHPADAVVLATGFRPALEDLLDPELLPPPGAWPPEGRPGPHPGLWFCGYLPELLRIRRAARRIARRIAADLAREP